MVVTMQACQQASGKSESGHMPRHCVRQDRLIRKRAETICKHYNENGGTGLNHTMVRRRNCI